MRGRFRRPAARTTELPLRPTAAGVYWLAAVLALLATAINYGNNLVFALAFLLLAVWLQSAWQCRRNLADAVWQPATPAPAFAGETLDISGSLRDRAGRPRRQLFLARGGVAGPAADLAVDGDAALSWPCPAAARGPQTLAGLALVSRHPHGLWQCRRPLPPVDTLVWPQPAGDAPLPQASPRPAHRAVAADDFQGIQSYVPGDPPRRINWRVWGRREELVVNRFDGGHGGDTLWLDWALCRDDTEPRLSQLARWVVDAERAGREYGLRLPGATLPPGRGRAHRNACLTRLALHEI